MTYSCGIDRSTRAQHRRHDLRHISETTLLPFSYIGDVEPGDPLLRKARLALRRKIFRTIHGTDMDMKLSWKRV